MKHPPPDNTMLLGKPSTHNNPITFTFQNRLFRCVLLLLALVCFSWLDSSAYGLQVFTATFDDLTEGTQGYSISDGGLTFSALDTRLGSRPGVFSIDQANGNLPSPMSPPNALNFGLVDNSPFGAFDRFGSAWIDFGGLGSAASVDVFSLYAPGGDDISKNSLALEAWDGTTLVVSTSVSFTTQLTVQYRMLSLTGVTFDRLRLISSGPVDNGVAFIMLDNVSVTLVPEPAPALLLSLSLVVGLCFRKLPAARPNKIARLCEKC
jgi:hypothetical protein